MRGAIPPLPQYAFMAWCLVKRRDNFTFTFYSYKLRAVDRHQSPGWEKSHTDWLAVGEDKAKSIKRKSQGNEGRALVHKKHTTEDSPSVYYSGGNTKKF